MRFSLEETGVASTQQQEAATTQAIVSVGSSWSASRSLDGSAADSRPRVPCGHELLAQTAIISLHLRDDQDRCRSSFRVLTASPPIGSLLNWRCGSRPNRPKWFLTDPNTRSKAHTIAHQIMSQPSPGRLIRSLGCRSAGTTCGASEGRSSPRPSRRRAGRRTTVRGIPTPRLSAIVPPLGDHSGR
jgi:hypothetical protein